jgi:hypothetical protein
VCACVCIYDRQVISDIGLITMIIQGATEKRDVPKILLPSQVACIVYKRVGLYKNITYLVTPDAKPDEISYSVAI